MNTINKINWLLACTALIMSSCQTKEMRAEPDPIAQNEMFTFTAMSGEESQTKTIRKEDGAIWWSPSDEIKIFSRESSGRFISQNTEGSASSLFTGSFDSPVSMESLSENGVVAFYPYSEDVTYDGETITFTLSALQNGVAGTFDDDLFPCIAKSVNTDLHFYNICGGAKFTVSRDDIRTVTLKGNNGEYLAGKVKVSFDSDGLPFVEVIEGETEVTVSAPDGDVFEIGKEYYIVTLPNMFKDGLRVIYNDNSLALYDKDGILLDPSVCLNNKIEIHRSKFGVIEGLDAKLSEIDMDSCINFKDKTVKGKCLIEYDTNYDGELSYNEAAAVGEGWIDEGLDLNFASMDIETFNELQYFINVDIIYAKTFKASKIKSIILPPNLKFIGSEAFMDCDSLQQIHIPEGVETIGDSAFEGSSSLKVVSLPSTITKIAEKAFYECINVNRVYISDIDTWFKISKYFNEHSYYNAALGTNHYMYNSPCYYGADLYVNGFPLTHITITADIPLYALSGCTSITHVDFDEELTKIKDYAFEGCSGLTSISIPDRIKSIGAFAFDGCKNLQTIKLPKYITSLDLGTFRGCVNLVEIEIPDYVTEFKSGVFRNCTSLKSISIPDATKVIPLSMFSGCINLESIIFNSSLIFPGPKRLWQ